MRDTPEDLRKRATRLRRGVGQLGILESIIEAAEGPWLGAMDADGRGAAELRMHLAGKYRLLVVVTSAGKISLVHVNSLSKGEGGEKILSTKTAQRKGWDEEKMPRPQEWLEYAVRWVSDVSGEVDRRAVVEWLLAGADRKLSTVNDVIESLRISLREQEEVRDERAAEVAELKAELKYLNAVAERQPAPEPRPAPIAAPEPAPIPRPEPVVEAEPVAEAETVTHSETVAEAEPIPQRETVAEAEPVAEAEHAPIAEADPASSAEPEISIAEPEPEPEFVEPQPAAREPVLETVGASAE
ncbi:hypothetical protein OHB26_26730 [Nocardia sp. NBC_01503]|uniref:hypothetical protein n=1 Tax=Nocardia sp. NBC_01503 TaxID=2975997 RepID=UPI002E7BC587|nr:hypothetical protein [Nocardia sp. NBC_01503]WTL30508.1 hypothetical protein OHB26_26730 [Nocardia sp. NBC_01503]